MKAVVVGGGIAGLPQGRHVHALLVRGGEIMEDLFPGLYDELVRAGAALIDADLVVDATGRSSKLPAWLAEAGITTSAPEMVDSRTGYATRTYTAPEGFPALVAEMLSAPDTSRGCAVMRVEGERLMVTAQGPGGDHPPRDPGEYQAFLESLRGPVAEMLREAEPISPIYLFARTASRRNAFEAVENWPGGLVAVGDSVCAFNPVYGQGMTVAAMEALEFRRHTDFSAKGCRDFQRKIAKSAQAAWLLSSNADRGWVDGGDETGPLTRVFSWYMKKWQIAITRDSGMFVRFLRVLHMIDGPGSLMNPVVFRRLAKYSRQARRQDRRPAAPSPR